MPTQRMSVTAVPTTEVSQRPDRNRVAWWIEQPWLPLIIAVLMIVAWNLIPPLQKLDQFVNKTSSRYAILVIMIGIALWYRHNPRVRAGFAQSLVAMVIVVALLYGQRMPFESWELYSHPSPTENEVYSFHLKSRDGEWVPIDMRSLGKMSTPTNYNRWARHIFKNATEEERSAYAATILQLVQRFQDHQADPWQSGLGHLKYPDHQFGYRWEGVESLEPIGPSSQVMIQKQTIRLQADQDWLPQEVAVERVVLRCS